jgi:hypothetical protein
MDDGTYCLTDYGVSKILAKKEGTISVTEKKLNEN